MSAGILRQLSKMSPQAVRRLFKASQHLGKREQLSEQADGLRRKLRRLDRRIARLDARLGTHGSARRKARKTGNRRKRATNRVPLKDVLANVLKKKGEPTRVTDLAKLALQAGYKTTSASAVFGRAVHQALNTGIEFTRKGRGLYALK